MYIPCLKDIQENFKNEIFNKDFEFFRKNGYEIEMRMFPQAWGSTALGFGGIGGQAFTSAYTIVVGEHHSNYWGVYFGDRLAYIIKNPSRVFFEDLKREHMADIATKSKYIRKGGAE